MAQFRIFVDEQNCLAVMGFSEDMADEQIRVVSISEMEKDHTLFVLPNGSIDLNMAFGEIVSKLKATSLGVDVEGIQRADWT